MHGQSSSAVEEQISPGQRRSTGWKTLTRWKRMALLDFWSSWAAQIGLGRTGEGAIGSDGAGRLSRVLGLFGADSRASAGQLHEIARSLTAGWRTFQTAMMEIKFVRTGRGPANQAKPVSSANPCSTRNVRSRAAGAFKGQERGDDKRSSAAVVGSSDLHHSRLALNERELLTAGAKPSP
jgi:hypothetical protein